MLAVDLGQSGARIRFNGEEFTSSRAKLAGESPIDSLRAIFSELPNIRSEIVSLCLTGFNGIVTDESSYGLLCKDFFNSKEVAVIDDGLAGYIGMLNGRSGVTLLVGGGVVSVGGRNGRFSHRDGLGSIFGDEGSGYWLGKNGLTRALASEENRDSHHDLQEVMKEEIFEFHELKSKNGSDAVALAIKSGRKLLEAADQGIQIAMEIRDEGARLLASTVFATWDGVSEGELENPEIVIEGGLSKNCNYKLKIEDEIRKKIKSAKFVPAEGDNLSGAIWIAENMKKDIPPMLRWAR